MAELTLQRDSVTQPLRGAPGERRAFSAGLSPLKNKDSMGPRGSSEDRAINQVITNSMNPTYLKKCSLFPGPYKRHFSFGIR